MGAGQLDETPDLARALERHAAVSGRPLALMQKLSDNDGDGFGSTFGAGDCDDRNPAISPAAEDLPDNGVDEDCSGSDLSLAGLASSQPKAPPPPSRLDGVPQAGNLLFVTVDTLRYDLGYAGYKRPISPKIDKLAARSSVIEHAYALASYTGKSVGPMLIGKYGSETHRNWGHFNTFSEADTFVAQRMQRAGIHTVSVQAHHYFGKFGGLERGFDELDLSAAPPKDAKWAHDARITSGLLTDAAIAQLKAVPKGKRFFAWVHYLDPHADYKRHEGAPNFGSKARGLYDGEVWFTDQQIGRLLDFVKKAGLSGNTSIILTSDHGEAFGEHKMWRHGFELWEVLVRVPLIVHVPGAPARRVSARRSLIDIVPTMLDLMRLPAVPHSSQAKGDNFVSGRSLVSDVLGDRSTNQARDILVDMPGGPYNESRRAFIHGDLKLIISRGAHKELYDLKADPAERKNIWRTDRKRIEAPYAAFKKGLKEIEVKGKRK